MFESLVYYIRSLFKQSFKVGIISYYYPVDKNMNNGVALHTYNLSRELVKLGCEVHVFTRTEKKLLKKEYLEDGKLVIHGIDTGIVNYIPDVVIQKRMRYFMFDNKIINEISKENLNSKFDIIHTHGWLTSGAFISKYLNNSKWIHTFHALEKNRLKFMSVEEKKYFQIAKWMESTICSADAVINVSQNLKKESTKEYHIKENKSFVIPNGVNEKVFFRDENIPKLKKVLYVGRFSLEKGIDFLPNIAQCVLDANSKAQFIIVAPDTNIPPSLEDIKKQFIYLSETYKERFVWIRTAKSSEELAKLYNEAEVYIQPSRYESFGMTILEAMACGCAVVSSNKGGIPEVVSNAGIVLPINISLFFRKILQMLDNYKLRERYSRRAIERAKQFNWGEITKKTLDLYQAISKKEISPTNKEVAFLGESLD